VWHDCLVSEFEDFDVRDLEFHAAGENVRIREDLLPEDMRVVEVRIPKVVTIAEVVSVALIRNISVTKVWTVGVIARDGTMLPSRFQRKSPRR
jgi:hypothetical protein